MVILAHNGERKVLRLNIAQSGSYSNTTQMPSSQSISANNVVASSLSTPNINTTVEVQNKTSPVEAILEKAVIKPYVVDGQVEGLKITGLENVNIAKYFGLKNGDVIRVVNGHRLTSKQKAFQVFKKAKLQEAISFELLRDDKTKTLSFNLR